MKRSITFLLLVMLLSGCSSSYVPMTHTQRGSGDLANTVFHVSNQIALRSLRVLVKPDSGTPFRSDGHRYLVVEESAPGRLVQQGPDWLAIDFGQGIVLRFAKAGSDEYRMPGWGTLTVEGERYDVQVGILSGMDVRLLMEPPRPS
jgi:hypothetical protein